MRRYLVQTISMLCIGILFIGCQSNNNETKENETTTEAEFVFLDDPEGKLYFTCKNINTDYFGFTLSQDETFFKNFYNDYYRPINETWKENLRW